VGEEPQRASVELVLVGLQTVSWCFEHMHKGSRYLKVAKLGKLLATVIQFAGKRLDLLVDNLVCSYVAPLSEGFATNLAPVWPLSSVPPLMSLQ
jgi:hypothetical protein